MTVKAYLLKKINVKNNKDEIVIERILENEPTFNLNTNKKILELIQKINGDNTNEDLTGELVIDKYTWKKILNNLLKENFTPIELKIIEKITNDLKDREIIYYECF